MSLVNRKKVIAEIKENQKSFLEENKLDNIPNLLRNFKRLNIELRELSRKDFSSNNSLKAIPAICRRIFGISTELKNYTLKKYNFEKEKMLVNQYVKSKIYSNISSKYNGKCKYGETLLNCYLDLIISFTTNKSKKEIESYPDFLINPITGQNMEVDILFTGFKLGFEFQGEHHYNGRDPKAMTKDKEKLNICVSKGMILIPVNACQLNSYQLSNLICNSVKDFLNIGRISNDIINGKVQKLVLECRKKDLINYFSVLYRIKMANNIFFDTFKELDIIAGNYTQQQNRYSPHTTTQIAPRAFDSGMDATFEQLYRTIPKISKSLKKA